MTSPAILVVEDEAIIGMRITGGLRTMGYRVVGVAKTGADALAMAKEHAPDLILMDIILTNSDIDGVETAEIITTRHDIPVIFLTAHADPATLERARLTAPYGYVLKPFEDRDLQITIEMGLYRHRMERRVRESEQWLSATLKGISDCVVATNRDGTIRMLNQAAQGLAHTDASTAEDKHWSAILPLRDRTTGQPTPDLVLQAMDQGQTVALPRECLLGAEGLPVEGSISPIFDLQNQVCGSVIVLRDIRQRLQLDKQIWESRKMEAARRLSGGISHEFNNALTSVIGFSEMLLENPLLGEQTRREYLKLLLNSARRAANQTKQLAAFASGQMLSPCQVDLNKVLQDLWKWLQESLKPGITVELKRTMILGSIKSDPNQVVEAILALVENAREAMPSGGRLTLETAVVDVSREMAAEHHLPAGGRFARLSVTDTGRGISPEDLLRAFDPYFTTKPVGKGPGLGLSQVHGLCRQCGGFATLESKLGQGTTASMYFPLADAPDPAKPDASAPSFRDMTVLLVEVDETVRAMTRTILERLGFTVLEAGRASEAIARAKASPQPIRLLMTESQLPDRSGRLLLEELAPLHPGLKVLFFSGPTDDEVLRGKLESREWKVLPKPFPLAELVSTIDGLLRSTSK